MNSRKLVPVLTIAVLILAIIALFISCGKKDSNSKAILYYINGSSFKLVAVETYLGASVTVEKVLEALFTGQDKGYLENLVPEGTKVLSATVEKNTLTLNLSKEFTKISRGPTSDNLLVMSVVSTAIDAAGVKQVKILIDGEEKPVFNNSVYLKSPIQKDSSVIE